MIKTAFSILLLLLINIQSVYAISAESAIVMDAESGRILYEKESHKKMGIASTTKIMTALVTLENCNVDECVTVSYNAATTEGSSMYLKAGEKLTVGDLLYGLMLNSGNDAATALAEHTSGDVEKFALLMNDKARNIGMKNSSFANPHGLDHENHYSTSYDMALLTKCAMENQTFKSIVGTKNKIIQNSDEEKYKYLKNHNKLLSMYEGCIGVKTGFTKKCGRCLVSYAEKDGVKLIVVTLNAPDDWNDHITLFNDYFDKYKLYTIVKSNDYTGSARIANTKGESIKLYCKNNISLTLSDEEYKKIKIRYIYKDSITTPIYRGQELGEISVYLDNKIIAKSPLVTKYGLAKVEKSSYGENFFYLYRNLLSMFLKEF